jgi:hypothetical protein
MRLGIPGSYATTFHMGLANLFIDDELSTLFMGNRAVFTEQGFPETIGPPC